MADIYSKAIFKCVCEACKKEFTCILPTRWCRDCYEKESKKLPKLFDCEVKKMTKTKEFKFRLTEKEFEEMRELAEQEGRTMSNLLRYLVAKERKEREK
jgi:hypothetical protein